MNKFDGKKKKRLQISFALALLILITIFIHNSKSELLEDDAEIKPKSELTYYLNVSYDGVDKNGVQSDDTKVSKINSGTIFIEDKLPDGLEFIGFVTTEDGTIGAVKKSDDSMCAGKVVDDTQEESNATGVWNDENTEYTYHGLHYDATTRTVTFKVKNIQAGCKLMVGIITKTPPLDDPDTPIIETRRDFYNFATARERTLNKQSNTVHVFMGKSNVVLQNVSYEYTGDIPEGVPELPETASYAPGTSVGVASNVKMEGYTFSGWTTEDTVITNNSFYMPTTDITLRGSFTALPDYKVTYTVTGEVPEDYVTPREERYYPDTVVELDALKQGDIINGYRFLGWESTDVELTEDNDFTMPAQDVTLTGSFEEEKYNVSYAFYDGIKPPDSEALLPQTKSYKPGAKVTLDDVNNEPNGYQFLGWLKDDEFEMPNEDVVILGEWKANSGNINLKINVEPETDQTYYAYKDVAERSIIIQNMNNYRVSNIMIKDSLDGAIINNINLKVTSLSDHIAQIDYLDPNESITIPITYTIQKNDIYELTNTIEIIGATAEDHELPETNYSANYKIGVQKPVKICAEIQGFDTGNIFQIDMISRDWGIHFNTSLKANECKTVYLNPANNYGWTFKETNPQEYIIYSIVANDETQINNDNNNYNNEINISLKPEEGPKTVTFKNTFNRKVFVHASGHVNNEALYKNR